MTEKEAPHKDNPDQEAIKGASEPTENEAVSDTNLDNVAGGFNPQPDPPAFQKQFETEANKFNRS